MKHEDIKKYIDYIDYEIKRWKIHKDCEDSPLGGNVVKAAHYGGTVAGLKMALEIFNEIVNETPERRVDGQRQNSNM